MTKLSVIVPVRNAESTLVGQVEQLLDVLPDLTSAFEILVVDDGSHDDTPEVAQELTRRYPQLRLVSTPTDASPSQRLDAALEAARGEMVIQHRGGPVRGSQLQQLWKQRHNPHLVTPTLLRQSEAQSPRRPMQVPRRRTTFPAHLQHVTLGD